MWSVAHVKELALQNCCSRPQSSALHPSRVHISMRERPVLMSTAAASCVVFMHATNSRVQPPAGLKKDKPDLMKLSMLRSGMPKAAHSSFENSVLVANAFARTVFWNNRPEVGLVAPRFPL